MSEPRERESPAWVAVALVLALGLGFVLGFVVGWATIAERLGAI